ncbi:uncharacterized protein PFL1_03479 [Pseudozyma flocculosa PF-1]|uniref:Pali-domain-containing protein n=1 Tax=Pseudozyma flocculosa PF-1 TaxID=1277687 RepID=A0A061H8H8_9BASI|nr:uncharacterized protein PFL1_03479 [Pseudozyma flocculosa PF-1]EPQ29192.1 hypothetical protein PFL1_03479 [Pseudozyma flocculosa PF-1]
MFSAATPGTVLTFAAAVLLGLVTISTPIWDSIYFLKAIIGGQGGQRGQTATLGVLGYCIGSKCSSPTIGYNFDPNELLGISIISAKYTSAVIKGLTYTLVLHPIALGLAAIAFLFGLLSHCRPASRNCMGMCFSGIATAITVIAFGLDLALFIVAKKRIDSVDGASADLGVGLWMTLAAAILLFLSGFAFCCGCGGRGRGPSRGRYSSYEPQSTYPQQQQQRQASQSGTRMQSPPRLLPAIPPVSPIDQAANSGIPYGGGGGSGSDAASPSRRQATLDDGFGLTAAATTLAGQRGGSRSEAHASEDGYGGGGYDNYASSAYGHHGAVQGQGQGQHERLPTRYEDAREGSVGQYQHQHQGQGGYYDEGQSSTGPPGYDSAMGGGGGGGGYGHAHSHGGAGQYPPEKRG